MLNELQLKDLEEKLKTNDYIASKPKDFQISNSKAIKEVCRIGFVAIVFGWILIGFLSGLITSLINNEFTGELSVFIFIITIMIMIKTYHEHSISPELAEKIHNLQNKVIEHNKNVYNNLLKSELEDNKIDNLTKELSIYHWDFHQEEVLGVNDDNKYLAYYKLEFNAFKSKFSGIIQKVDYKNIIKYELIDNSTTSQTATSITSSNAGKALGGAIISDLLIGNSTTGAIIGGSGKRTTETTYKTSVKNDYQIVIYLNSLEYSTITINTPYRNKVNDIISLLEYILHNQTEQNYI